MKDIKRQSRLNTLIASTLLGFTLLSQSCAPKVSIEPITINLNVKVEHEISVKVDKELDALFDDDADLF